MTERGRLKQSLSGPTRILTESQRKLGQVSRALSAQDSRETHFNASSVLRRGSKWLVIVDTGEECTLRVQGWASTGSQLRSPQGERED